MFPGIRKQKEITATDVRFQFQTRSTLREVLGCVARFPRPTVSWGCSCVAPPRYAYANRSGKSVIHLVLGFKEVIFSCPQGRWS